MYHKKRIKKIIAVFILSYIMFSLTSCIPVKVSNVDKYLITDGFISHFSIFPKQNEFTGEIIEYHYYDYQVMDGDEIYLEIHYDIEAFEKEIERLSEVVYYSTKWKYENAIKVDDSVLFNYYTFVSIYNHSGRYEYACVDFEQQTIIYIFLNEISLGRISIDEKYIPKTYYITDSTYSDDNIDPYCYNMYEDNVETWYE